MNDSIHKPQTGDARRCAASAPLRTIDGLLPAAAALPATVLMARFATGISLSPDSLAYLLAARNLFGAWGLIGHDGEALTILPPFYPFLVALVGLFVDSSESAAMMVSVGSMGVSAGLFYLLIRSFSFRPYAALGMVLLVFLHPQMQTVFWFAWSEAPYILISLLALLALVRTRPAAIRRTALVVGILAGLGFLTRYAGVVLLPTAMVGLLCVSHVGLKNRLQAASSAAVVGGLIISLWVLRNLWADGTVLGPRSGSVDSLMTTARSLLSAIGGWVLPLPGISGSWVVVGLAAGVLSGLLILLGCRNLYRDEPRLVSLCAFLLLHLGLLVYSQLRTTIDPIDFRLLSPAVAPGVLVMAWSARHLARQASSFRARWLAPVLMAALVLACAFLSVRWIGAAPLGYGAYGLHAQSGPAYCRETGRSVFTSSPAYLRYSSLAANAERLPRSEMYRTQLRRDDWKQFVETLGRGDACLIWLGRAGGEVPSPTALLGGDPEAVEVQLLSEKDGVFFFRARIGSDRIQQR